MFKSPRRRVVALSLLLAVLVPIAAPFAASAAEADAAPASGRTAAVRIDNFTFAPVEITVAPGTTVTWTNGDDMPHSVAASDKSFRSKVMDTDGSFSYTFATTGNFEYFCTLHPHMTGMVRVVAP